MTAIFAYSGCWQASVSRVRLGRTVNQRSVGKARERWHEQGGTVWFGGRALLVRWFIVANVSGIAAVAELEL